MPDGVFYKLVEQLARLNFSGRFSYHFYNEPLLRKNLGDLVARVATRLPEAHQVLYTNGDLLTDERYTDLLRRGIRHFIVTRHDSTPIASRELQTILYPSDLVLTNRGGAMSALPEALTLRCFAPAEMLIVTVTGDIVLCYEDARREHVMGNILRQDLEAIWFGADFVRLREILIKGARGDAASICRGCDNRAHSKPGTSWFAL